MMDTVRFHLTAIQEKYLAGEFGGIKSWFFMSSSCLEGRK